MLFSGHHQNGIYFLDILTCCAIEGLMITINEQILILSSK